MISQYDNVLFLCPALIGLIGLLGLMINSRQVHADLEKFRRRAKLLNSRAELMLLRDELTRYYHKRCFVIQYGDHARVVCAFIDGKLSKIG